MCTAGKQGNASRRSLTRQHKVSPRREYRSPKDDCGILSWGRQSVVRPFCNRTVNSASFRNVLVYISPYGVLCPFFHSSHPPVLFSPHLPPPIFHSGSPVIFSVKFDCRLSALSSTACRRKTTAEQTSQPSSCNGCAIRYFMSGVPNRSLLYVPAVGHPPFLTGHISFFIFSSHPLYQFPPSVFLPFALHPVTGLVLSDAKVGCRT